MQKVTMIIAAFFFCIFMTSCASDRMVKEGERNVKKPINCNYAEGDIRALQSEKTTAMEQMATGVTTIVPVGLVMNTVEGDTMTNAKVATGDYNDMLDKKIAEIQKTCGVK